MPSRPGRIYDCICSDSCVIQAPLTLQAGPYMTSIDSRARHNKSRSLPVSTDLTSLLAGGSTLSHGPQHCRMGAVGVGCPSDFCLLCQGSRFTPLPLSEGWGEGSQIARSGTAALPLTLSRRERGHHLGA